jgi:uncharacterized protein DUF3795
MHVSEMKMKLIAPCGMNCALCLGFQRDKNRCSGCLEKDKGKPKYCRVCSIRNCTHIQNSKSKLCFECKTFPCRRLKELDKRYRTKYGMSMIENLKSIQEIGKRAFVKREQKRWACSKCHELICVHREECPSCGKKRKIKVISK